MTYQVIHGDCLEVMREMPADSVDAVVTDPPYGQSNEGYDRGVSREVWQECFRVCRENAVLLSFAGSPTYHRIASGIEQSGWHVRQMWAWVYRDGFMTSAYPREGFDRLAPAMDPICYATKGKVLLNLEREGDNAWLRDRGAAYVTYSERSTTQGAPSARGHWPRSITASNGVDGFEYFILSRASPSLRAERCGHPNQKPLSLMRWLISKLPPGGVILDPFTGSGSTGCAAVAEGFGFVGIEQDAEYVRYAVNRIAYHATLRAQLPLEVASAD